MIVHQMVVSIGNSNNKLTQKEWHFYVKEVGLLMMSRSVDIWFSGFSASDAPWQNACWWVAVDGEQINYIRDALKRIKTTFKNDSVAMIIADETEMV